MISSFFGKLKLVCDTWNFFYVMIASFIGILAALKRDLLSV